MLDFYFNYKDLFKAPRAAIGPQRLTLATLGVFLTHFIYLFFTYLALLVSGNSPTIVWQKSGLLPTLAAYHTSWVSVTIYWIGVLFSLYVFMIANTAVARASYMFLRDNLFYTWKQSLQFALKKAVSVAGTYLTFLFLIMPFILGAIIMAAIGKIAWVGEILNALATLPYIFSGMVLVFLTLSLMVAFFFGPVIIASSEEDGFGSAVQALHLTWGQPWRLVLYGVIIIILQILAVFFFAFILKVGLIIYSILFMPLMHSLRHILDAALYLIQNSLGPLDQMIRDIIGFTGSRLFYLKRLYLPMDLQLSQQIAAFIVYISMLLAAYMTLGYGLATGNTALTISYAIFNKKLTSSDLFERKDSEIEEDQEEDKIEPDSDDVKKLDEQ